MREIKLAIVVGHSKKKTGAYNKKFNITEYFLNEELAKHIKKECDARDINSFIFYRLNGYKKLPYEINKQNPTHTICLHHNASPKQSVNGVETLYWKRSKVSDVFAKLVNDAMAEAQGYKNRGLKPVSQGQNGGHVLRNTSMPCILTETYFMSNNEAVKNREPKVVAVSIVDAFEKYIKG